MSRKQSDVQWTSIPANARSVSLRAGPQRHRFVDNALALAARRRKVRARRATRLFSSHYRLGAVRRAARVELLQHGQVPKRSQRHRFEIGWGLYRPTWVRIPPCPPSTKRPASAGFFVGGGQGGVDEPARFDRFAGSESERDRIWRSRPAGHIWPQGEAQDAPSNPTLSASSNLDLLLGPFHSATLYVAIHAHARRMNSFENQLLKRSLDARLGSSRKDPLLNLSLLAHAQRGYFGIGLEGDRATVNMGIVLRAASCFGAAFVAAQPGRLKYSRADTQKTHRHIPIFAAQDLMGLLPRGCKAVAVEVSDRAEALTLFKHPEQAYYLFGPEQGSLSPELMDQCEGVVQIPTADCLNLGVSVNVVLYDRLLKGVSRSSA